MTTRALIYCRTSGDDTEADNLENQEFNCKKYCEKKGYSVVAVLKEDERGVSGKSLDAPELEKALELAKAGTYDVFICTKICRLARRVFKHSYYEAELAKCNVDIEYTTQPLDLSTPAGRLNKNILRDFAEYEAEIITQRLLDGRLKNARRGSVVACGRVPYGLETAEIPDGDRTKTTLVGNEYARVIQDIYTWYAKQGMTVRAIAQKLTGTPTWYDLYERRTGRTSKRRTSKPGVWKHAVVTKILTNPVYRGEWAMGEFPVAIAPLVSPELWQAAQDRKTHNRNHRLGQGHTTYLLAGMVQCECGAAMAGHTVKVSGKVYQYYRCNAERNMHDYGRKCTRKGVRCKTIENTMWAILNGWLKNPDDLEQVVREQEKARQVTQTADRERLKTIDDLLEGKKAEYSRLVELYVSGDIAKEFLVDKKTALEKQISDLEREKAKTADFLAQTPDAETIIRHMRHMISRLKRISLQGDKGRQHVRQFLLEMGTQITVCHNDEIELFCYLGEEGFLLPDIATSG